MTLAEESGKARAWKVTFSEGGKWQMEDKRK